MNKYSNNIYRNCLRFYDPILCEDIISLKDTDDLLNHSKQQTHKLNNILR